MIPFSGLSRFSGHFDGDEPSPQNRDTTVYITHLKISLKYLGLCAYYSESSFGIIVVTAVEIEIHVEVDRIELRTNLSYFFKNIQKYLGMVVYLAVLVYLLVAIL